MTPILGICRIPGCVFQVPVLNSGGPSFVDRHGGSATLTCMICATPVRRTRRRKSKKRTSKNYGTLVRRARRQKSTTHEFSKIMGLLRAEQNVGNLEKCVLVIMGLLCAEQNVGNLRNRKFNNFGTPVRRTRRRK